MKATATPNANFLDRLDAFQIRFGMRHVYLAMHAAFPISLTPNLLFTLRDNFNRDNRGISLDIPWEAVSDILLSDLCQVVGYETFRMEAGMRHFLLERLKNMSRFGIPRLKELNNFINQYFGASIKSHNPDQKALAEAQLWAAQLQVDEEIALELLSRNLKTAIEQKDRSTQMRLHYLLDYFPLLEGEVAKLRTYAKGNALRLVGLEDEVGSELSQSGENHPKIGGQEFPLLRDNSSAGEEESLGSGIKVEINEEIKVFISYQWEDQDLVETIENRLLRTGIKTWRDVHKIQPGENIHRRIGEGIQDSDLILIVLSKHSLASKWVKVEIEKSLQKAAKFKQWIVLPVLIDETPVPKWVKKKDLIKLQTHEPKELEVLATTIIDRVRAGKKASVIEIQRQLRWLGLYDGQLNGDWATTSKVFRSDFNSDFSSDFGGTSSSLESFVAYAKQFIADRRQQLRTPTVFIQGCEQVITILKQVLDFWGVQPREYSIYKELLDKEYPSRFNDVETAELILLGVDSALLKSLRFQKILEIAKRNSTDIAPIILKECDWQNAGLGSFVPILDASEGLVKLDETELVRSLQLGLGRTLLHLSDSKKDFLRESQSETKIQRSNPLIWLLYSKVHDQELANKVALFLDDHGMQTYFVDTEQMSLPPRLIPHGIVILKVRQRDIWVREIVSNIDKNFSSQNSYKRGKNLYIGNLSYKLDEEKLRSIFSHYGEIVSAFIVKDRMTGRSKGFGFVEFANVDDAKHASDHLEEGGLNESQVDGRKMMVSIARPMFGGVPGHDLDLRDIKMLIITQEPMTQAYNLGIDLKLIEEKEFKNSPRWGEYFESIRETQQARISATLPLAKPGDEATVTENRETEEPLRVFLSYSNRDIEILRQLRKNLEVFERDGQISLWDPSPMIEGEIYEQRILEQIETADIIVILVSADYFASKFVMDIELRHALKKAENGTAILFPILARHCDYQSTPLNAYGFANSGLSLASDVESDRALVRISKEFSIILENVLLKKRANIDPNGSENLAEVVHGSNPIIWLVYAKHIDQQLANEISQFLLNHGMRTQFVDIDEIWLAPAPNPSGVVVLEGGQSHSWLQKAISFIHVELDKKGPKADPRKLFVTNFSWAKTELDLRELFSPYGELVSAKLITDRETGKSRGFGFVEFANADDAKNASADMDDGGLHGAEVDGRAIAVVVAKPREQQPPISGTADNLTASTDVELLVLVKSSFGIASRLNLGTKWKVVEENGYENSPRWGEYFESIKKTHEAQITAEESPILKLVEEIPGVETGKLDVPLRVFLSYSTKDREMLSSLQRNLSPLERSGRIIVWEPSMVLVGDDWQARILEELEKADIIVIMVSADYFASPFVIDVELKVALERAEKGKARLFPMVVSYCDYRSTPLVKYAFANSAIPLEEERDLDDAFARITAQLKELLEPLYQLKQVHPEEKKQSRNWVPIDRRLTVELLRLAVSQKVLGSSKQKWNAEHWHRLREYLDDVSDNLMTELGGGLDGKGNFLTPPDIRTVKNFLMVSEEETRSMRNSPNKRAGIPSPNTVDSLVRLLGFRLDGIRDFEGCMEELQLHPDIVREENIDILELISLWVNDRGKASASLEIQDKPVVAKEKSVLIQNSDTLANSKESFQSQNRQLFISFEREPASMSIANALKAFVNQEFPYFTVVWDERGWVTGENNRHPIRNLTKGDCIIFLISLSFLKSQGCMYELALTTEYEDFKAMALPIVFPEVEITTGRQVARLVGEWSDEWHQLNLELEAIAKKNPKHVSREMTEELERLSKIAEGAGRALHFVRGQKWLEMDAKGGIDIGSLQAYLRKWIEPEGEKGQDVFRKAQVLVITGTELEYKEVRNHLVDLKTKVHPDGETRYEIGVGPNSVWVAIAEIGAWNANAGSEVERVFSYWNPEYAFFVGVAGGIKDVQLGDVVAATTVFSYESGKANDEFRLRPDLGASSYELVQLAKDIRRNDLWLNRIHPFIPPAPKCFVGKIAAVEKIVASTKSDTYNLITQHFNDVLAIEMEGIGFLKAASKNQIKAMVIRGISDLIDGKAHADSKGYQEIASRNAAAFAFEMIARSFSEIPTESINTEFDWERLEELAVALYPKGPKDSGIWERAGGNVSILKNEDNRKQMWRSALHELRKGGAGKSITALSLIKEMAKDYPKNDDLEALKD